MANDTMDRWSLLVVVILFSLVACRPAWVIWALSYGKRGTRDIDATLLSVTRIIAAVSAIWSAVYLIWNFVRK